MSDNELSADELAYRPKLRYTIAARPETPVEANLPFPSERFTVWVLDDEGDPEADVFESDGYEECARFIEAEEGDLILGVRVTDAHFDHYAVDPEFDDESSPLVSYGSTTLEVDELGHWNVVAPFSDLGELEVAADQGKVTVDRYWIIVYDDQMPLGFLPDADSTSSSLDLAYKRATYLYDQDKSRHVAVYDVLIRNTVHLWLP